MTLSYVRFGGPLLVLALVACGIQEAAWGGDLAHRVAARQEVGACKVLDLQAAIQVIGRGTEQLGDTEQALCMYSNPGVAQLTIQLYPAESYDQITILKPHTPVQIGDKARYNVEKTGVVAVQLVSGGYSATLSVRPFGRSKTDYLEPLLAAARELVDRLP